MAPVVMAVQMPIARPRIAPSKREVMSASELGTRNARAGDDQDDGVWRDRDHDGCRGESVEADAQHEQPAEGIRDRTGEQDE